MLELNQIYHGDCLDVMKEIDDKSIDMILCDLPYGTTVCKWDTIIPFEPLWEQYKRIIKDNGVVVLCGQEPFSSYLRMSNINKYRYDFKWDKVVGSNFVQCKKMPLKIYEDIMIFYDKLPTYNPQMKLRKKENFRISGKNELKVNNVTNIKQLSNIESTKYMYPTNKIEIHRQKNELNSHNILHPTQKPVALFEYLIKTYTNEGDLVLDNCSGSGTTAIACINTNRNYILIEKDKKYYNDSVNRVKEHSSQKKLF